MAGVALLEPFFLKKNATSFANMRKSAFFFPKKWPFLAISKPTRPNEVQYLVFLGPGEGPVRVLIAERQSIDRSNLDPQL